MVFLWCLGEPFYMVGTTRENKPRGVMLQYGARMSTFTVWSWCLQGVYFLAVTLLMLAKQRGVSAADLDGLFESQVVARLPFLAFLPRFSSLAAQSVWVLFELSCSIAILITVIVTYVLYPMAAKKGLDVNDLFTW